MSPKRAMVYIDGFNFYYGLREINPGAKWLDFQSLAEGFMQEGTVLAGVKYFTARIRPHNDNHGKCWRQENYHKALSAHSTKLEIIYGHYIYVSRRCPKCEDWSRVPSEKRTDVNIASHMLADAYEGVFDIAYLISGDSDLIAPVEIIVNRLEKHIIIVALPKRKNQHLIDSASNSLFVDKNRISRHLLPAEVTKGERIYTRPKKWDWAEAEGESAEEAGNLSP